MKCNVGTADRILRIVIGVFALGAGWYFESWWGLLGLIPLLTGIFKFCGAYAIFGASTCKE
mgnify:CR=1 FL=1